jgi:hypothetical protein
MEKTITKSEEFIALCKSFDVDPDSIPEIISFEQACEFRKIDPQNCLPDVSMFPADHQQALLATAKMYIISEALNQDVNTGECWKPDWNNWDENKYYPWFDLEVEEENPSGFRFHGSDYVYVFTLSTGGSRLCYRSREISNYAGQQFLSLYKEMVVLPK